MEENKFGINKKYIYAGLITAAALFGFFMYSLGSKGNASEGIEVNGMINSNPSDSMDSHHRNNAPIPSLGEKIFFEKAVGSKSPDFSLESAQGKTIKLSDYKGKKVVLFFNEGSMCYPACWNQMASLTEDKELNNKDVVAFSIVVDQKSQWENIIKKVPKLSNSAILLDSDKAVSNAYGALNLESSMHKGSYPGHTFFVIDRVGIIRYALDDPEMAIRNNELLSELSKIE